MSEINDEIASMIRKSILRDRFTPEECKNGNHYFIKYNEGNLICKKCGRFAKMGYLRREDT